MKTPARTRILAIETSCDETAIAILEARAEKIGVRFSILADKISSQVAIHAPFGGVVPNLAKREHQKNLVPLLLLALKESGLFKKSPLSLRPTTYALQPILEREPDLLKRFEKELPKIEKPQIDAVAVTYGPGLEPALWVGINFARALSKLWDLPLIPVNHLEGHICSAFMRPSAFHVPLSKHIFPLLTLIVSGGHTELVLTKNHLSHKILGETKDDAAGEAFDKVAKMLGLPYPGGPEISKHALKGNDKAYEFPRPMLSSPDLNFSFSGLKTSVLYKLQDIPKRNAKIVNDISASFQEAAVDVLVKKTERAFKKFHPKTVALGGGVAANDLLRERLKKTFPNVLLPEKAFTGDNAAMIGVAAYFLSKTKYVRPKEILKANGALKLS